MSKETDRYCSFCGRKEKDTNMLISGAEAFICDVCLSNGYEMLSFENEKEDMKLISSFNNMTPKKIKKKLDEYVIGQDEAKKVLSISVYNHYKRLSLNITNDEIELNKNNVLLLGPTGVGKTLLAKTLARILHVPFAMADATSLTEAGYVGDDVETIITRLIDNANGDISLAEKGIIYIDEIDKIARKSRGNSITRDVSGEGVQQGLLKIIEGTEASVPLALGRKNPNQEMVKVDTTNILFIIGGAFPFIDSIVQKRFNKKDIGFDTESQQKILTDKEIYKAVTSEDIIEFGLIPEFMGRISNIAPLVPLDEKDMLHILTKPKNAIIKQYMKSFEMENVELEFEKDGLKYLAKKTIEKKVGARGLNSILESTMSDLMYEVPSNKKIKKIIINKDVIDKKIPPIIKLKNDKRTK